MARRTFFSHSQPDIWRAMNVRKSWVVTDNHEDRGFFDSSVFEANKRESEDALKRFLREALVNTSVTCVLTGPRTWQRRWVKYEIARSVIKGNGLLNTYTGSRTTIRRRPPRAHPPLPAPLRQVSAAAVASGSCQ